MKRNLMKELIKWKDKTDKSPLMLLGARQVGKTYLLEEFAKENFQEYVYINFENQPDKKKIFDKDLDPKRIISEIELDIFKKINPENTLIFFDEIQQSPETITALKYFKEQLPEYNIVCAGSLLGTMLLRNDLSFPVGKVEFLYLYPFTFDEFLYGVEKDILVDKIKECYITDQQMPAHIHDKLIEFYKRYLCIGGMPACINNYIKNGEDLIEFDKSIQDNILNAYIADMSKYTRSAEAIKVQDIYKSIPNQLARENKKFKYSTVSEGSKAMQYESAIEWLITSRINLKCKCINHADFPLSAYHVDNIFKIYMSDTGLLNRMGRIPYAVIMGDENHIFKGAITENYVATELASNNIELYYYKRNAEEVDFIIQKEEKIIPIEVKANKGTRSRSLNNYISRYNPNIAIRVSTKNFGLVNNIKSVPLYSVFCI